LLKNNALKLQDELGNLSMSSEAKPKVERNQSPPYILMSDPEEEKTGFDDYNGSENNN